VVTEKGISIKRTVPFLAVGILVFLAYIYFFVGIDEILAIIQEVDLVDYGLAIAAIFLTMLTNALTWHYFLRPLAVKVSFRKTFLFTWIGVFVDLLVPAESISGDASMVYMMTKETNENTGKVVASVLSHRLLLMIISLSSLIFSSIILYVIQYELAAPVLNFVLLIIIGTGITVFFLFLCCLKEKLTQKLIDKVLRFVVFISRNRLNIDGIQVKVTKALSAFQDSISYLRKNPKNLVLPTFFALASWIFSILISYLVFIGLGQHVDFILILVVYSISVNIQSIPVGIPAEVGVVEIVMASLYGLLGIEAGIATAATILIRLLTVWLRIAIGFIAIQWIDLKELAKNLKQDLF
jgi:uncharacterized protein (TIRG00374 family)